MLVTASPMDNSPNTLSVVEEEATNVTDIDDAFPPHVDTSNIVIQPESPTSKKQALKTFAEVNTLLQAGRKREAKLIIRENAWPLNNGIRAQLWPALCDQHAHGKNMLDGFYWDMVNQVFGTTELPEKSIMLPPFVDSTHCLSYNLTRKGRNVADRIVSVLGYACPDITYSPSLYPLTALLLHFVPEEECYHCMATLVAAKEKMFITQTKLLYEVTWKTVEQITKKHVKSAAVHLARHCSGSRAERIYMDWIWWILQLLPFQHLVRVMDCFLHEGIKVFYRVAMAIVLLFYKHSSPQNSEWMNEISKNGIDAALSKFCRQMPVTPAKFLRTAFGIRGLSSAYISRVFLRTEMSLKSKSVLTGSRSLARSRSTDNLPTSQSQVNIQMMSHTLTIREKECEDTYKDRVSYNYLFGKCVVSFMCSAHLYFLPFILRYHLYYIHTLHALTHRHTFVVPSFVAVIYPSAMTPLIHLPLFNAAVTNTLVSNVYCNA
ncbi:TBC1 domain family member 24 isoform X1 [Temnothorax curvispinosus]|uniref:TBC1 domain family member 24 isoform X1 n=1 Tax=Temnothorax curvispinosus TaxID=300111 RepID=A0A6J1QW02_9HYME|nr:TBC1 domain family member 24 isoform X1 [Temnothorax curvispinosus]XP_024886064.1 TBC1 domain family member 24 isoform X1 [Temnothorax curvispinosus]XP_024886065.1 TBC1 domain family member 24 isoform X1 [Temnothorax curvispinosus]